MSARPAEGLARFMKPRPMPRPGEACDMCRESIPDEHGHVVALKTRGLMCTCRGCYLLFTREGAAQGHYRAVPTRVLYDANFPLTTPQWDALQIPVRMAFFFFNSSMDRLVGLYPSPAGATESDVPHEGWQDVLRANPALDSLEPDVEAVLIVRQPHAFECFVVPIDACYELVGRVRRSWKGFGGGEEAWRDIDGFFAQLRARATGSA